MKKLVLILIVLALLAGATAAAAQGTLTHLFVYDAYTPNDWQVGDKIVCRARAEIYSVATQERAGVILDCTEKAGAQPGNIKKKVKPWERE
jgi:hypothetical protein